MACKEKCFTFIWKLKNFNYFLREIQADKNVISSPSFVLDWINETKWHLNIYMTDGEDENDISLFLAKEGEKLIGREIIFDLDFLLEDDSVSTIGNRFRYDFAEYASYGRPSILNRDLHILNRSELPPQDTLTARCRIWNSVGEMTEDIWCLARSRIEVQKRSFTWNVRNFSFLEPEKKYPYRMKSIENDAPLLSVNLFLTGGLNFEQIIRFEMSLQNGTRMFLAIRLSLVDASGTRVQCNQEEFRFLDPEKSKEFKFIFTMKELLAMKSSYLPHDTLSLHWELAFSDGAVSEKIEEVQYECASSESKSSNAGNGTIRDKMPLSYASNSNLKSLYDENFLCDVIRKTSTSEFPAHKLILSASSSVFKAMFSLDMKEKANDSVNIIDLNDDAVNGMLLYMYTGSVDDLTWEMASYLYVAADKYAILSLKDICSFYMKDNLSPSNACEALLLSDFHCDNELKSAVQNYIIKHGKQITDSEEWKTLIETNAKIAAETLCTMFK